MQRRGRLQKKKVKRYPNSNALKDMTAQELR